jgi:multisubunit Na+/H+ antiporter MnhB subunit
MKRRTTTRTTLALSTIASVALVVPARARAAGDGAAPGDDTAARDEAAARGGTAAGDDTAAPDDRAGSPSRALPITLVAIGAPAIVFGVIGMAFDEDPSPKLGPTIWDTGPTGAVAVTTGAAFTIAGTYLYLKHADGRSRAARPWMKWTGLATIGGSAIVTGLGIKLAFDRRQADRDLYECHCSGSETFKALLAERERVDSRAAVALGAGAVTAVAGVALLLASHEGTAGTRIQVTATTASVGWGTSF